MSPAMDRGLRTPSRPFWVMVGLAVCLSDLGCSRIRSRVWGESPPTLGQVVDTNEVYTQAHRSRTEGSTPPGQLQAGVEGDPSMLAQVEEVGAAILPAEATLDASTTGVQLQSPSPVDHPGASKRMNATIGVPNASRILASAGRRSEPKSSPSESDPARIVAESRGALDSMTSYQVAMHRQERVNGTLLPEEDVVLAVRRSPRAIRLSWPSGPNQGREVLYRADDPKGQMHVKMANPALPRLAMNPESPMVMRNSRHPVTEAGFDSLVEALEGALKGPASSGIADAGVETLNGFDQPLHVLVRTTPSGETWRVAIDTRTHLPALVEAVNAQGELLERYLFRDVRPDLSELASPEAFDPIARWGQPRGLFGRVSRASAGEADPSPR